MKLQELYGNLHGNEFNNKRMWAMYSCDLAPSDFHPSAVFKKILAAPRFKTILSWKYL
jgi:hypothetical protein